MCGGGGGVCVCVWGEVCVCVGGEVCVCVWGGGKNVATYQSV